MAWAAESAISGGLGKGRKRLVLGHWDRPHGFGEDAFIAGCLFVGARRSRLIHPAAPQPTAIKHPGSPF